MEGKYETKRDSFNDLTNFGSLNDIRDLCYTTTVWTHLFVIVDKFWSTQKKEGEIRKNRVGLQSIRNFLPFALLGLPSN